MSVTFNSVPISLGAAYSILPIQLYSTEDDLTQLDSYSMILNLCWNKRDTSFMGIYQYNGELCTRVDVSGTHNLQVGDRIFLNESQNGFYTGYYNVIGLVSSYIFLIDLVPTIGFDNGGSENIVYKAIKYKVIPDKNYDTDMFGMSNIDLSPVLKDLVYGTFQDYNGLYRGYNNQIEYALYTGEEYRYEFPFDDNYYVTGGFLGFSNSSAGSVNDTRFKVGDEIYVEQDKVLWNATKLYSSGGYLTFSAATQHSFLEGQQIDIYNSYSNIFNGVTTVKSATTYTLQTNVVYTGASVTYGAYIYGTPRPSYDGVVTITDIFMSGGYGLVIATDKIFGPSSVPIDGKIRYADNRYISELTQDFDGYFYAYDAYLDRNKWGLNSYDKYVQVAAPSTGNSFSTILDYNKTYRLEKNTKGYMLMHSIGGNFKSVVYEWYNSSGSLISTSYLPTGSGTYNKDDWYCPIGIDQVYNATGRIDLSPMSGYVNTISSYKVFGSRFSATSNPSTYKYSFELNDDCSSYEIFHLIWKDSYGSYLSYPFKYISKEFIDVEKKGYLKKENINFGDMIYDSYGRGTTDYYGRSKESFILNSGWLEEFEVDLMKDLIQSVEIFVQKSDNKVYACTLSDTKIELYKKDYQEMIQYQFNVISATNEYRY